ncbi:uncharacterized protein LOC116007493 [Ipomoea triloba]|uniref:uncharacterized protein LOC116007493 n=1 Tax=Ipomoea triloba TaxID=35885 RepID=UPI00125D0581|nr:uncharacterized protein LOC116007493 [Ipomoea triloba]
MWQGEGDCYPCFCRLSFCDSGLACVWNGLGLFVECGFISLVEDHIGMGWVLRDHDGFFVAAQAITTPGPILPREAEALAVREALSRLKNNHLDNIIVETDAVVLVRNLHKPSLSPFGLLMDDITVLLSAFQNVKLCHVRRDANVVAHLLVCYAFSHCTSVTWVDSGPLFISSVVLHDLSIN